MLLFNEKLAINAEMVKQLFDLSVGITIRKIRWWQKVNVSHIGFNLDVHLYKYKLHLFIGTKNKEVE
jgi:hypothetical protein